ncbi:hypothetical protein V2S66_32930 [Streptomyces sp. V4-01]|uniref:Uncharacterized protein n=1 Tax=Actinacidiphila polyblastidii TaxID=3110430 RepID=A0ABU7PLP6_9ACTN|nr:hypothetical protein [Streptomyces sp. V4-01]
MPQYSIARVLIDRAPATERRLVAAGVIRRHGGRTVRITATPAGVTGSIRPVGGVR